MISGYFFEKSSVRLSTYELLINKRDTVLIPYVIFILPWIVFQLFVAPYIGSKFNRVDIKYVEDVLITTFFASNYWFVLNLLIILFINSYIKNISRSKLLVVGFGVITLFYSLNIHYFWVSTAHTVAIFGFLSFFCIGRLIFRYKNYCKRLLAEIEKLRYSRLTFVVAAVFFYWLSIEESMVLMKQDHEHVDISNVLRLSNILFTFFLFILFYKRRHKWKFSQNFDNKSVFLIYLIHPYYHMIGTASAKYLGVNFEIFTYRNIPINLGYGIIVLFLSLKTAVCIRSLPIFQFIFRKKTKVKEEIKRYADGHVRFQKKY